MRCGIFFFNFLYFYWWLPYIQVYSMCFILCSINVIITYRSLYSVLMSIHSTVGSITMSFAPFKLSPILSEIILHCVFKWCPHRIIYLVWFRLYFRFPLICWDPHLVWRLDSCQPVYLCRYVCPSSIWLYGGIRSSPDRAILDDAACNTWCTSPTSIAQLYVSWGAIV